MTLETTIEKARMDKLRFRSLDGRDVAPAEWLRMWSSLYRGYDEAEYRSLIAAHETFSAADFERIGRWKDNAGADGRWKPNVAMVAYKIWVQASLEMPRCPDQNHIAEFLLDWSERKYRNEYKSSVVQERCFGLSSATTILHFISGGRYPIFDSRVRRAASRVLDSPVANTVQWYLDSYCPLVSRVAIECGVTDVRSVDRALFCYGARRLPCSK